MTSAFMVEPTLQVLDDADVIVATCIGAGDPVLEGRDFRVCVIDEATQVGIRPRKDVNTLSCSITLKPDV